LRLKPDTIKGVDRLSQDPDYKHFFDEMSNMGYSTELVDKLTEIFSFEIEVSGEQSKKLNFALRLAYLAGLADSKKESE
jgi:hypothetical protein